MVYFTPFPVVVQKPESKYEQDRPMASFVFVEEYVAFFFKVYLILFFALSFLFRFYFVVLFVVVCYLLFFCFPLSPRSTLGLTGGLTSIAMCLFSEIHSCVFHLFLLSVL